MKTIHLLAIAFLLCTATAFASCSKYEPVIEQHRPGNENNGNDDNGNGEETSTSNNMNIRIGSRTFTATLADNEAAKTFKTLLPMTVEMKELNGNEKYHYLSENLPADTYRPGTIQEGDLMLYGSNCLVLFYEAFSSSYSYTRIGKIDSPAGFAETAGAGNINVTFELSNQE